MARLVNTPPYSPILSSVFHSVSPWRRLWFQVGASALALGLLVIWGVGCVPAGGGGPGPGGNGQDDTAGDGGVTADGGIWGGGGGGTGDGGVYDWVPPFAQALPSGSVISPEHGGTVSTVDGSVSVTFVPGATAEPVVVSLNTGTGLPLPPPGVVDLGLTVDVEVKTESGGEPVEQLLVPAYIHFKYEEPEQMLGPVSSLVVYGHVSTPPGSDGGDGDGGDEGDRGAGGQGSEAGGGEWHPLPTALSAANGTVMGVTDHFSSFGLFMPSLSGALGCTGSGLCVTTPHTQDPIYSMGMDGSGNLYFMYGSGIHIYRKPAGGGPESVEVFFDVRQAYEGMSLYYNRVAVSPRSGNVYLLRNYQIFKITPAGDWSLLFPLEADTKMKVHGMKINPNDGSLWAQCTEPETPARLMQLNPENGKVEQEVEFPDRVRSLFYHENAWTFDSQGRLYAMRENALYVLHTPEDPAETWRVVAEGFVVSSRGHGHRRTLTADTSGRVYAAGVVSLCEEEGCQDDRDETGLASSFITVIGTGKDGRGGDGESIVIGTIKSPIQPMVLQVANNSLLVSDGTGISALPLGRLDSSAGKASSLTSPVVGSLSGKGSFVSLKGTVSPNVPSHGVWLGDVRLRLAQAHPGELRFLIPSYNYQWSQVKDELPYLGHNVRMTIPSGELVATMDGERVVLGELETPEPGNYKPHRYDLSNTQGTCTPAGPGPGVQPPLEIAVGEWVIWSPNVTAQWEWEITSREELFPQWRAVEHGPWLAYKFTSPGKYSFHWVKGEGETCECEVRVSAGGAPSYYTDFEVDPAAGASVYSNGASLKIPPGALPGTEPYQVRIYTSTVSPPQSDTPEPPSVEGRHRQSFTISPEPDRLNGTIRFGTVGAGAGASGPVPVYFDDGKNSQVPNSWWQSSYVPLEYESAGPGGRVELVLRPGDYSVEEPSIDWGSSGASLKSGAKPHLGYRIKAKVSEITSRLWWKAGMPNEKVESTNFTILYNTRDGITADKALVAHEGLTMARSRFKSMGYKVPNWVIVTIDKNLGAEGSTSGLGRLSHWNMTLAGWLADEDLRSAAAHELFHLIQYENMSYGARARKFQWDWWMEGGAVWAENLLFPGESSAADWVKDGADFIHKGITNYNSLSEKQAYACVALVDFLEKKHPGAVLSILGKLGTLKAPDAALVEEVGDMGEFMEKFATAYFSQTEEPYASWDLTKAFKDPLVADKPNTVLINQRMPPYSAVGVKMSVSSDSGGVGVPVSFTEATGSVIRPVHCGPMDATVVVDKSGDVVDSIVGTLDPEGMVFDTAATYTGDNHLTVFYSNGGHRECAASVRYEVPTITSITPPSFNYQSPVNLEIHGGGFGDRETPCTVNIFHMDYELSAPPTDDMVRVNLPANTFTPMPLGVKIHHPSGVMSNTKTVTVVGDDD